MLLSQGIDVIVFTDQRKILNSLKIALKFDSLWHLNSNFKKVLQLKDICSAAIIVKSLKSRLHIESLQIHYSHFHSNEVAFEDSCMGSGLNFFSDGSEYHNVCQSLLHALKLDYTTHYVHYQFNIPNDSS